MKSIFSAVLFLALAGCGRNFNVDDPFKDTSMSNRGLTVTLNNASSHVLQLSVSIHEASHDEGCQSPWSDARSGTIAAGASGTVEASMRCYSHPNLRAGNFAIEQDPSDTSTPAWTRFAKDWNELPNDQAIVNCSDAGCTIK